MTDSAAGWHYPTRLNARPGMYQSEDGKTWMFDPEEGGQWFLETAPNHYVDRFVPTWGDNGRTPIAVKWIGELETWCREREKNAAALGLPRNPAVDAAENIIKNHDASVIGHTDPELRKGLWLAIDLFADAVNPEEK